MKRRIIGTVTIFMASVALAATAHAAARDPLKQPFSSKSIWNMPIGKGAIYAPANLRDSIGNDGWTPMPQLDIERIVLRPTAPLTAVNYNGAAWSGGDRCDASGKTLTNVPIPADYIVPNTRDNNGAVFLMPDKRTLVQSQPFTRCINGGAATSLLTFPNVDLYGDGITGAHGGSKLSTLGGTLRVGELRRGGVAPRHALKIDVYSKAALYNCTAFADCYRWPALVADAGATNDYGSVNNNQNKEMKMGALLAIPASQNLGALGLEAQPGKMLAWTLQNYGAYIVDTAPGPNFNIAAEDGPDGNFANQFQADWGYSVNQRIRDNTPWTRDMLRLISALKVVANNGPNTIGGGGKPLQPLATELVAPVVAKIASQPAPKQIPTRTNKNNPPAKKR